MLITISTFILKSMFVVIWRGCHAGLVGLAMVLQVSGNGLLVLM